ncbi:hypothetical protein [Mesorhizobium sp.]|uniref:hypothetical protein n=1 Tax=Mesorhizobium sp. TaxID=1871066 RepID=UPI0025C090A6|nr:hypothetical protein [Mesorhizobium sp.]
MKVTPFPSRRSNNIDPVARGEDVLARHDDEAPHRWIREQILAEVGKLGFKEWDG